MSWVAIEDASSAFERPAWAVEKMVAEGKLESRTDADGRVFVRRPPTLDELASELAPFLPDEVVPVVAVPFDEIEEELPRDRPVAVPSREEQMLRAVWALLEKQQAQLDELRFLAARPLALPAPPVAAEPPRLKPIASARRAPRRRETRSVARGALATFALCIVVAAVGASFTLLSQAMILRASSEQASIAPVESFAATTLPAGFKR